VVLSQLSLARQEIASKVSNTLLMARTMHGPFVLDSSYSFDSFACLYGCVCVDVCVCVGWCGVCVLICVCVCACVCVCVCVCIWGLCCGSSVYVCAFM
jgi:hypothetical protein